MAPDSSSSLFMRLGASRRLTSVLGAVSVGAVACGLATDLPLAVRATLAACALLAGARCIALHGARRSPRAIVLLAWDRHGRWRLLQRDGRVLDVRLAPGGYAHPQLVVLAFRSARGRRRVHVLAVPGMVDADQLRRLRARLRCESAREP